MPELRVRLRDALAAAGAVPAGPRVLSRVGTPPARPFAAATVVEGASLAARAVGGPEPLGDLVAFVDGIQRYTVVGHVGVTPVVHAAVAAAVVVRADQQLRAEAVEQREFLVIPDGRLREDARRALAAADLPIEASEAGDRAHPLADLVRAGEAVERVREDVEREVTRRYRTAHGEGWLLVDGGVSALADGDDPRLIGLIKSHETQFLEGHDLEVALTLDCGERSSVFRRTGRREVDTWYLRLWPWAERDLLHGLVRVECGGRAAPGHADRVSRWLLAERAPIARDARWDRLLYPIHEIETLLSARLGAWP